MKTTDFYQTLMMVAAFALIGVIASPVSAQYASEMGTTWNNPISVSASAMLIGRLGEGSPRSSGSAATSQFTAAQMNRAVTFRAAAGTSPVALDPFVNGFNLNTEQKTRLKIVLGQFLSNYNDEARRDGYPNDLALAFGSFLAMTSAVYHETALPPDDKVLELRHRIATIAVRDRIFSNMDDRQKQMAAEALVLIGGLSYLGYVDAKGRGAANEIKNF